MNLPRREFLPMMLAPLASSLPSPGLKLSWEQDDRFKNLEWWRAWAGGLIAIIDEREGDSWSWRVGTAKYDRLQLPRAAWHAPGDMEISGCCASREEAMRSAQSAFDIYQQLKNTVQP